MRLQSISLFTGVFFSLLVSTALMAQDYRKQWSDGKLSWQDFTEKENTLGITELKYYLGYNTGKQKFGDTVVLRPIAICYMNKNLSWINSQAKSDQLLRYNQVIFDIVELHRRNLQYELDRMYSMYELDGRFNHIFNLCNNEIAQFQKESNGGQDLNSLSLWEEKISDALEHTPQNQLPEIEVRNVGYAMHAGLGTGFFTGSIKEHFSPTINFVFGFDFAFKKSILYFNGTLAGDNIKKEYVSDFTWPENERAHVAIIDVSYGYAFIDNANFKVSPFAGLGITELSVPSEDGTDNGLRMVDYSMICGINADYKFRTRLKLMPTLFTGKEKVESSIRARLYITKANFAEELQGYSINLTVGICGFGNLIRVK